MDLARSAVCEAFDETYGKIKVLNHFDREVCRDAKNLANYVLSTDSRILCIMLISFLEDVLKRNYCEIWSISSGMKKKEYFGGNGPLSTFHQRLLIASAMGWLRKEAGADATILKKIRNIFAHDYRVTCLSQGEVSGLVSSLRPHEEFPSEALSQYSELLSGIDREHRFKMRIFSSTMYIVGEFISRSRKSLNDIPMSWSEGGYDGLMHVQQKLIDICIYYCFRSVGYRESAWKSLEYDLSNI